jgi:SAM-dependent methyltransferase
MSNSTIHVPEEFRRGGKKENENESVASGFSLLQLMCKKLGIADLAGKDLLDMGCGNKFTQAILEGGLPINRYVGIDIHPELIAFLQSNVTDDRFTFYTSNTQNAMYNPKGKPLSEKTRLPLEEESFDFICLFSVFTHLAPNDYVGMLKLLRRYIKPEGRIFFSLIVNELTAGGHGFFDKMAPSIEAALTEQELEIGLQGPKDFVDWVPERPLWRAVYSRENALRLVADTGWEIESLNDPEENIQHYMICKPV